MGKMGRPVRAMPLDFAVRWIEFDNWEEAQDYWGAHTRVLQRWLAEAGGSELETRRHRAKDARRAVKNRARRKNYVLGNRLTYRKTSDISRLSSMTLDLDRAD